MLGSGDIHSSILLSMSTLSTLRLFWLPQIVSWNSGHQVESCNLYTLPGNLTILTTTRKSTFAATRASILTWSSSCVLIAAPTNNCFLQINAQHHSCMAHREPMPTTHVGLWDGERWMSPWHQFMHLLNFENCDKTMTEVSWMSEVCETETIEHFAYERFKVENMSTPLHSSFLPIILTGQWIISIFLEICPSNYGNEFTFVVYYWQLSCKDHTFNRIINLI